MSLPADNRHRPRRVARASRIAVWAFALVLVVKSAVPLLASASALLQGKAVAEVCNVYGVATIALDADGQTIGVTASSASSASSAMAADMASAMSMSMSTSTSTSMASGGHAHHDHHHDPTDHLAHGGDHCALTAVVALAATASAALPPSAATSIAIVTRRLRDPAAPIDASARWAARLGHGPPIQA